MQPSEMHCPGLSDSLYYISVYLMAYYLHTSVMKLMFYTANVGKSTHLPCLLLLYYGDILTFQNFLHIKNVYCSKQDTLSNFHLQSFRLFVLRLKISSHWFLNCVFRGSRMPTDYLKNK